MFKVGDYISDATRDGNFVYKIIDNDRVRSDGKPRWIVQIVKDHEKILKNGHIYKNIVLYEKYWNIVPEPTEQDSILKKIKYLDERKQLDKSRIVPPKGIYRGSHKVSEVQTPSAAGSPGTTGFVSVNGQALSAEDIQYLLNNLTIRNTSVDRVYDISTYSFNPL